MDSLQNRMKDHFPNSRRCFKKKVLGTKRLFLQRRKAARQPVDKHIAEKDKAGRQNPTVETNLQQFWDHLWEDDDDENNYLG